MEHQGTADPKKKKRLQSIQATTLVELLDVIKDAQQKHRGSDQQGFRFRKHIEWVARRIDYYGNIMDVLVQQHPEYVALAWGTMKLLVGVCTYTSASTFTTLVLTMINQAIVEHEKIGKVIANGLVDIADALPRIELITTIYPTEMVKQMAGVLYAHIIRFLLRALEWYEEGTWKRALHSVTKPASLQYDDIIEDIRRAKENIAASAVTSSQAEQRDMHKQLISVQNLVEKSVEESSMKHQDLQSKLQHLNDLVDELKQIIVQNQALACNEQAHISRTVSTIQSVQTLQVITSLCTIDHQSCLHDARAMKEQRRFTIRVTCTPFCKSDRLRAWNRSPASSLICIKVPLANRRPLQDFCVNVIEQLLLSQIIVLWVLKQKDGFFSIIDTVKSLISQLATLTYTPGREKISPQQLQMFVNAQLEDQYVEILVGLLSQLRLVYITVQLEAVPTVSAAGFMSCLQRIIQQLTSCGAGTVVRVLILTWSPKGVHEEGEQMRPNVQVRKTSRRKKTRLPRRPLPEIEIKA